MFGIRVRKEVPECFLGEVLINPIVSVLSLSACNYVHLSTQFTYANEHLQVF